MQFSLVFLYLWLFEILVIMCLFPIKSSGLAAAKGVTEFKCGACPECLQQRSSSWALRSVYEARQHLNNCMITLTYDSFKNSSRPSDGENPVNPDLRVNKRHIQLFIKRLRKHFSDRRIKYIACAEYGSRTHRAHYHCILFGVAFPDLSYYKKSKRGNPIYMSKTLTDLWGHGICTVDSINVYSAVARYCTKYCAKSRSSDTFMLFSQEIGLRGLLNSFNGRSYFIDGREYPVPRIVWQHYISQKYSNFQLPFSYKYVNHNYNLCSEDDSAYNQSLKLRQTYFNIRDRDPVYCDYLQYWRSRIKVFNRLKSPVLNRIYALDERKYHFYKVAALGAYFKRTLSSKPWRAPGSKCLSHYLRSVSEQFGYDLSDMLSRNLRLAIPPRPIMASDTTDNSFLKINTHFLNFSFTSQ